MSLITFITKKLNFSLFLGLISTSKMCSFEEEESNSLFVELSDSWLCFESKFSCLDYMLELRHKWFAYFLQMLNKPGSFLGQVSFLDFYVVFPTHHLRFFYDPYFIWVKIIFYRLRLRPNGLSAVL